ncbi:MAG: hypothetical protein LIO85_07850 [Rikenellaceae bacterium]|nr:hypothetical protein [Rikenellaceae bacterium]
METKQETNQALKCSNCGAPVKYQPGTVSVYCEYCKSYSTVAPEKAAEAPGANLFHTKACSCHRCRAVYDTARTPGLKNCLICNEPVYGDDLLDMTCMAPSYVIPFRVEESRFRADIKKWLPKNRKTPNPFADNGKVTDLVISRVYYPCWIPALSDTVIEELSNPRFEYKTKLFPAVDRLFSLRTFDVLDGFDLSAIKPVQEVVPDDGVQLLYGNPTGKFKDDEKVFKAEMDLGVKRIYSFQTKKENLRLDLLLLPVYVCSYVYGKTRYCIFGNGYNGKIGRDPEVLAGEKKARKSKRVNRSILVAVIAICLFSLYQTFWNTDDTTQKYSEEYITEFLGNHTFAVAPAGQDTGSRVDERPLIGVAPVGELTRATGWVRYNGGWYDSPNKILSTASAGYRSDWTQYNMGDDNFRSLKLFTMEYGGKDYLLLIKESEHGNRYYWVLDDSARTAFLSVGDKETNVVALKVYVKGTLNSLQQNPGDVADDILKTAAKTPSSYGRTLEMLDVIICPDKEAGSVKFWTDRSYYYVYIPHNSISHTVGHEGADELLSKYYETSYSDFSKLFKLP